MSSTLARISTLCCLYVPAKDLGKGKNRISMKGGFDLANSSHFANRTYALTLFHPLRRVQQDRSTVLLM